MLIGSSLCELFAEPLNIGEIYVLIGGAELLENGRDPVPDEVIYGTVVRQESLQRIRHLQRLGRVARVNTVEIRAIA